MFYSLAILTLLASILFYSFYPRNDGIKNVDMPNLKVDATEILAHHMAAVEAARVLFRDSEDNNKLKMTYQTWTENRSISFDNYSSHMPAGTQASTFATPKLYCFNNSDGTTGNCAQRTANRTNNIYGSSDYIITFGGKFDDTLTARALGEKVHLTSYAQNEHLKALCGILEYVEPITASSESDKQVEYDYQGTCMITNTRYQSVRLPRRFVCTEEGTGSYTGHLVCITQISTAYEDKKRIYPQ